MEQGVQRVSVAAANLDGDDSDGSNSSSGAGDETGGNSGGKGDEEEEEEDNSTPEGVEVAPPIPHPDPITRTMEAIFPKMLEMFKSYSSPLVAANAAMAAQLEALKEKVEGGSSSRMNKAASGIKMPAAFTNSEGGIKIRDWLDRMEDYFSIYKTQDYQRLELLPNNLGGAARVWFNNKKREESEGWPSTLTWEEMKAQMVERFTTKFSDFRNAVAFTRIRQEGRSLSQYTADFTNKME